MSKPIDNWNLANRVNTDERLSTFSIEGVKLPDNVFWVEDGKRHQEHGGGGAVRQLVKHRAKLGTLVQKPSGVTIERVKKRT